MQALKSCRSALEEARMLFDHISGNRRRRFNSVRTNPLALQKPVWYFLAWRIPGYVLKNRSMIARASSSVTPRFAANRLSPMPYRMPKSNVLADLRHDNIFFCADVRTPPDSFITLASRMSSYLRSNRLAAV